MRPDLNEAQLRQLPFVQRDQDTASVWKPLKHLRSKRFGEYFVAWAQGGGNNTVSTGMQVCCLMLLRVNVCV
jgi:streptomycin 6-kinase